MSDKNSRWIEYNNNPAGARVSDCVIRAISAAMNETWHGIYWQLVDYGAQHCDLPNADYIWGAFLADNGYFRYLVNKTSQPYTVNDFCKDNEYGTYILSCPGHVVCVKDGYYYDAWDSGQNIPTYFWCKIK